MIEKAISQKEFRIFGYGNMYPTHVRVVGETLEAQAGGFDSQYARLREEDAFQELLALENSSGDPVFENRYALMKRLYEEFDLCQYKILYDYYRRSILVTIPFEDKDAYIKKVLDERDIEWYEVDEILVVTDAESF